MRIRTRSLLAAALLASASLVTPAAPAALSTTPDTTEDATRVPYELARGFVVTESNGQRSCRIATFDETDSMNLREPGEELHVINPWKLDKSQRGSEAGGMTIVLRGTQQLESFPAAKAAYIRSAETWEALIRTPITVIIDVDFGPKRFGQTYPAGVLGSTNSQFGTIARSWSSVRGRMLDRANSPEETALLNALPPTSGIPTTEGPATLIYIPTAVQRALGFLSATPNESGEMGDFGPPPSIGFNSAFLYDFDPTDGVPSNRQDFNATALHEIGHALGLVSHVGLKDLVPSNPVVLTTWDLFRFRTGISLSTFTTAQRVLDAGGEQVEFSGSAITTRLSTGRPDGSGGDNNQASHWKDNVLNSNTYIGIMDPTGADGDKDQLTAIDLVTLDLIGYDVRGLVDFADAFGTLDGNTITITGNGVVGNLVLSTARVELFEADGDSLTTLPVVQIDARGNSLVPISIDVPGLQNFLSATYAEVTLVDENGVQSAPIRVDFGLADAGAPTITGVSYNGKKMKLTGTGFTGTLQLEVNGVVTTATVKGKNSKAQIKGTAAQLGLVSGPNRIRVFSGALHSNIAVFNR